MAQNPTIQAYDAFAQMYDEEVIDFWDNFPVEFLETFTALVSGRRVLDVGSGSGRDALILRQSGYDVTCLDASKSMVAMTRQLGFTTHFTDFAHMDFADSSFDAVWAYTSLIHVPKDEAIAAMRKLHDYLCPGGVFAIGVIAGDTAAMVQRYFKNYTSAELRSTIEPLGFTHTFECGYKPGSKTYISQLYVKTD